MPICFDLKEIFDKHKPNIYFETGLWNVDNETSLTQALRLPFDKFCSVDISQWHIAKAQNKYESLIQDNKLKLFLGDSINLSKYLEDLSPTLDDKILFFLDSHGGQTACPLMEELEAIKNLERKDHIIMIDDIRIIRTCIWSDHRYKSSNDFEKQLKDKILEINSQYKFSYLKGVVDDDVLIAFI
jgi:hypothetical protein